MNLFPLNARGRLILRGLTILAATSWSSAVLGAEYEVDGSLSQTTFQLNGTNTHRAVSFTVFVRDCGWLIQTIETNQSGRATRREIGSTNGTEIFEFSMGLSAAQPPPNQVGTNRSEAGAVSPGGRFTNPTVTTATIILNNIPVGQNEGVVAGHLWLMFASQCLWPGLKGNQLTPVYDWQASVAARGQNRRMKAEWDLLSGPRSLPREVRYLGQWDETKAIYTATGTNSAGGTLIPSGFVFEERRIGPLDEAALIHRMEVRMRVEVQVTAVRPICSRASLIPVPKGRTIVIDRRLPEGPSRQTPSYQNPVPGQWATVEEARKLVDAKNAGQ